MSTQGMSAPTGKITTMPIRMRELVIMLMDHGWNFQVIHRMDTGNSPFVTIEAKKLDRQTLTATWHTRQTGTYRLWTPMIGKHTTTLSKLMDEVIL